MLCLLLYLNNEQCYNKIRKSDSSEVLVKVKNAFLFFLFFFINLSSTSQTVIAFYSLKGQSITSTEFLGISLWSSPSQVIFQGFTLFGDKKVSLNVSDNYIWVLYASSGSFYFLQRCERQLCSICIG